MERVCVLEGVYRGLRGDAFYLPNERLYHVSIPNRKRPEITDYYPPESLHVLEKAERPILDKKEFLRLQDTYDEVQIIGCKGSCNSVWCPECYKRKGGSKRFANRLSELDYKATRQVVLTVDLKKFDGSGRKAFEFLKSCKAIPQFIHNLKRTSKINVVDWVWVLEWHTDGAPHWHLFIQTIQGKKGKIGNATLLKHWQYGLVFESFIKSKKHWQKFTDYFSANGYFNPKQSTERKDKRHQLELPEWAKNYTCRIRKTGAMVRKKDISNDIEESFIEDLTEDKKLKNEQCNNAKSEKKHTYKEILDSCGKSTFCLIRRGKNNQVWLRINISYSCFMAFPGEYIPGVGYVVQMKLNDFFLFLGLYDNDIVANSNEAIFDN